MNEAIASSIGVVAYLALFAGVGLLFLFANLLIGRFVRPRNPHAQKGDTYECGEPAVGSGFVQYDLRFYVVALLFIIFDVEVAFFFPWATVFGKSTHLADRRTQEQLVEWHDGELRLTKQAAGLYREMGIRNPQPPTEIPASLRLEMFAANSSAKVTRVARAPAADRAPEEPPVSQQSQVLSSRIIQLGARQLALLTIVDIAIFFAVLLVGFAYVWMRGDLEWVRAVREPPVETTR